MPIGAILLIKFIFDMFGHQVFDFNIINCIFSLDRFNITSFIASAIISELSGMSIIFYFKIVVDICETSIILNYYLSTKQQFHHINNINQQQPINYFAEYLIIQFQQQNSKFNVIFCQMKSQKQNKNPNQIVKKSCLSASSYLNNQEPLFEKCLAKKTVCKTHSKQIGKYFCVDCFRYNICMDCISQNHSNHSFLQFKGFEQSKQFTKELILQEIQETLKKLKSKQNEVNNQIAEVKIIKDKLKNLQDQIITSLRHSFQSLQQKIVQKYECEYKKYEKELDIFYEEHNQVNDHLRRNLIEIIDNQIDIYQFSKQKIYKHIDEKYVPNFGKIKNIMERCKKYYKNIGESLKPLQNAIKFFNKEEIKHNSKFQKYDRFLKQKTVNEGDYCSPLLKTLNLIERNQCDFPLMISKLRN